MREIADSVDPDRPNDIRIVLWNSGVAGAIERRNMGDQAYAELEAWMLALSNTTSGGTSFDAARPVYNRLVQFKPGSTEVEPALAESWTVSPDGLTITFKLRPGIKFHSGVNGFTPTRDLNAEDVIWSFDRQWKPDHPFAKVSGGSYDYFNDMSMPDLLDTVAKGDDDLTVVMTLKKPNAPIIANLAMDFATIHSAEYAKFLSDKGTPEQFDQIPVGTGSFSFVAYQKDAVIRYKAFDAHWGGRPKIDNLIYRACRDSQLLKDGSSVALPSGQKIAHGGTGMTKAKIIQARKLFRANEKDVHAGEQLFMAYTADMVEDIMSDTTLTSSDFLANQFLQQGDVVGNWLGFTWIPFEGIDPVSSSTYYTVAWAKSAIHLGDGYVEGRVDRRPDKKNLWQTTINCSMNAGRQDEKGVVEIAYQ